MSNPTFRSGPITFPAGEKLDKYSLVGIDNAALQLADGTKQVVGVVTEAAQPAGKHPAGALGLPEHVAVHVSGVVPIRTDDKGIKPGEVLYAKAGGKVTKTPGTVIVGWAAAAEKHGRVRTSLTITPTKQ